MFDNHDTPAGKIKEAVCVDTSRVYDSCADKDCLADMRVYFTDSAQDIIDNALSIRCRGCEVLNVCTEIERVPFNRGFYSIDLTFYFLVSLDVFVSPQCPGETVNGLCVSNKKCILYGSDGNVKIFSSEFNENDIDDRLPVTNTNPRAKVQVADPICLDAKLCRPCECCDNISEVSNGIPRSIRNRFCGQFITPSVNKAVRVTLGVFTIVQLERDVQMLIPAYDFCMPCKECTCETEDPCESFRRIKFPVDEFFPPNEKKINADCGCKNDHTQNQCGCSN